MISYCANGRSAKVLACPLETFSQIVDSPQVAQTCELLRGMEHDSDEAKRAKQQLPLLLFYANYTDGHRHAESAVPTGLAYLDLDDLQGENPREVWPRLRRVIVDKELDDLVMLVHVSCSGKGLRVVFRIPQQFGHLTATEQIDQAKQWLAGVLGVVDDSKTKDLARGSFAVPRGYILYGPDRRLFEGEVSLAGVQTTPAPPNLGGECGGELACFKGVPYREIIAEWFRRTGGEPAVGERNDRLHRLAAHLRYITDNNEATLLAIMPRYGLSEEEMRGLIRSACQGRFCSMPKLLGEVVQTLTSQQQEATLPSGQGELSQLFASSVPPELPPTLPRLVKAVTQCTPQRYKATVAQAMFPALAAYPKGLKFLYIDNQTRELRINCLVVAGTGSGKDSCTSQPLAHIIADMKERDDANRERLKKFNDEFNSKAGNKQKPQRPEGLVIQTIKSDVTKAALVQRMADAQGAPLYTRLNELEQWDKIEAAAGRSNQFTVLKLCDDEGNDFGADRASTQSVNGSGVLHLNWNANTTTAKAIRYFRNVVTDGPISRLCLATIPDEEIGADIAVFGNYDEEYDAALRPYISNLKQATGLVDCPQARRLARRLKDECARFAQLSQDRVFDNLTHRALVFAFRKACLLYVANGMKWEKAIESFCRWSLFYDLYLKMKLWGDQIRHADDDIRTSRRGPQSLLELLPDVFTVEDAKLVRIKLGMDTEHTVKMIRNWSNRGYVTQNSEFSFKKVKGEG